MVAQTVSFGGYRVAGVMLNRGRVLLSTDEQVDFWVLPGGSVKPFESSDKAIRREFREEIGVDIEIVRLLWVVENSFVFDELKVHGIGLDFLVEPLEWKGKITHEEFYGLETDYKVTGTRYERIDELELTFRWFDIAELDTIEIRPRVYHRALRQIPEHPVLLRNLEVQR